MMKAMLYAVYFNFKMQGILGFHRSVLEAPILLIQAFMVMLPFIKDEINYFYITS